MTNDQRKDFVAYVGGQLKDGHFPEFVEQLFPYTLVKIFITLPDPFRNSFVNRCKGLGFSKAIPTDEWDSERGIKIARGSAINNAIREWEKLCHPF